MTDFHHFWFRLTSNDTVLSQMVLFEITQPPMRKLAISGPFLDYTLSFWVQINPNGYSIVPNSLQRNHATFQWYIWPYLAHFLTDCHHFRFKWTSNDIALSQMVLHEITQPPVRKMAVSSPFLYWFLSFLVQMNTKGYQIVPNSLQRNHATFQG